MPAKNALPILFEINLYKHNKEIPSTHIPSMMDSSFLPDNNACPLHTRSVHHQGPLSAALADQWP